ncbi:serine/threonine protein kinase [Janthinobacterium sp. HH01]|uniref:leucine-rich repeat-containing protein kinase family protein n=1 Tax=Janthinobacterium sp. HH01 TaxID=1198452 RepID=UPI0002AE8D67|nr:leucine-rich repeat-containing protein kinase family protein [Janthinobacterium sp. HH01]ELX09899.1 serine/threonine protein kinase [Janthinobacterium sp. HH01]
MHTLAQLRAGQLAGIQRLQLSSGLTEFPPEIFDLADTLEILDLSDNALSTLPDDLPRLTRLRVIFCSANRFTVLPAVLGACPGLTMIGFKSNQIREVPAASLPLQLRWLILTDNRVEELPAAIGACTQLQKLMLAGNRLRALPPQLAACTRLELVRLAANRLEELPDWLLGMPRLSWLAYAGNPFSAADEQAADAATSIAGIAWERLQIGQKLGEGASGVIHQAALRQAEGERAIGEQEVAVKLFKGAVTSDGLPRCEMTAFVNSGDHPNLIPVLGEVLGHPDGVHGCVMPLIDPDFGNLAGPPSLESCTRDTYPVGKRFSAEELFGVAGGIVSAARHLHQRGIMHGDLYGHNILHCGRGRSLLGDFGAASLYAPDGPHAAALQRLEVRAFGLLLEELMDRCDLPAATQASLAALQAQCVSADVGARPSLAEAEQLIKSLRA